MDPGLVNQQSIFLNDIDDYSDWEEFKHPPIDDESLEHLAHTLIEQNNAFHEPIDEERKIVNKKRSAETRFTLSEDKQILKLVFQVGPNFNKIVKYFPGKTMNMVKNRYYKKLRYMKDDLQSDQDDPKKTHRPKTQNQKLQ